MSFDLALKRGDLTIGSDGDISKVRNTTKLVQDVLKIVHTPVGANPFFPQLGSNITVLNIGENLTQDFAETRVEASITKSIQQLQVMQRQQEIRQEVTPEEKVFDISEVSASRNEQDPRQFDIKVVVLTGATTTIELPSFSLSTTISSEQT